MEAETPEYPFRRERAGRDHILWTVELGCKPFENGNHLVGPGALEHGFHTQRVIGRDVSPPGERPPV